MTTPTTDPHEKIRVAHPLGFAFSKGAAFEFSYLTNTFRFHPAIP
jgi:hypothetical protein